MDKITETLKEERLNLEAIAKAFGIDTSPEFIDALMMQIARVRIQMVRELKATA